MSAFSSRKNGPMNIVVMGLAETRTLRNERLNELTYLRIFGSLDLISFELSKGFVKRIPLILFIEIVDRYVGFTTSNWPSQM